MSAVSHSLVVAGPSGVGKSSIIRAALEEFPQWTFSISATTRARREHETDGEDYFFLTRREFAERISAGHFLEYAEVYGNLYGTLHSEFERARAAGRHMIIEIDSVGSLSIRALRPQIPNVAIVPPYLGILRKRLEGRGTEDSVEIAIRAGQAWIELARLRNFDFMVVNDELDPAVEQFKNILRVVESGNTRVAETIDDVLKTAQEINV